MPGNNRSLKQAGGLESRFAVAWEAFMGAAKDWIDVEHCDSRGSLETIYRRVLDGKAAPNTGYVVSIR